MLRVISITFLFTFFLFPSQPNAQEVDISKKFKKNTISKLSDLMNDYYVFPEIAKKTETHLLEKWESGYFDEFKDLESFADALTISVQEINKDKHMKIRKNPVYVAKEDTPERMIEEKIDRIRRAREWNAGFNKVEILDGNVGLIDLRNFAPMSLGKEITDHYMNLVKSTDAVIIDLRRNGGGSPEMVQYLCSYFFNKRIHLNSLYFREGDVTKEFWTLDEVGGVKRPDVPLFVLTSESTFSGAEEFSYNMQTQERATLVGETTGGGANPGGVSLINKELGVFIPSGRAINPITNTNWEGVGVLPDVKISHDDALGKAHELAKKSADSYRKEYEKELTEQLSALNTILAAYSGRENDLSVQEILTALSKSGVLNENDINMLGYENLAVDSKIKIALEIFKTNTILYSNSANVHDSLGEALMTSKKFREASTAFAKAVSLAEQNNDPNLEFFRKNLDAANRKM